jgi:hypothetical protein
MQTKWFTNRGQVIQTIFTVCGGLGGLVTLFTFVHKLWPHLASVAPWALNCLTIGGLVLVGVAVGARWLGWIQHVDFPVQEIYPVNDQNAPGYKLKLRIVLRNDSKLHVDVQKPRWLRPEENDLHTQIPLGSSFEPEAEDTTRRRWEPEAEEVRLRPGQRVRVWIGVDGTRCTFAELSARIANRRELGTLEFPVKAVGQEFKVKVRVTPP